ncbi:MAG: UDP-2,3-diacylglucosamine diphosphatase [Pseudomonadota bacterium]
MSGATYFISDLHLDAERPHVTRALEGFLTARRDAEAVYILGDLFEFWIGDDDDSAIATDVAQILADFSSAGPSLFLMHGNRDFLLGERFAEETGAVLLDDPTVTEIGGVRVLLMHGDSLCTRDEEYQAFRALARSPDWQASVLAQSLDQRRAMASQLRAASKDAGSRKAPDIMDVTESEVDKALAESATNVLIHGHTHRPNRHATEAGTRWVLGDWDQSGWYIKAEPDNIELIEFDIIQ